MAGGGANCTGADRGRSARTRTERNNVYHTRLLLVVCRILSLGVGVLALVAQTSLQTALAARRELVRSDGSGVDGGRLPGMGGPRCT